MPKWIDREFVSGLKEILVRNPSDIDWTANQIVQMFYNVVQSGQIEPTITDFKFCPKCGAGSLKLVRIVQEDYHTMGLLCKECKWLFPHKDDWAYLSENLKNILVDRYGEPERYDVSRYNDTAFTANG